MIIANTDISMVILPCRVIFLSSFRVLDNKFSLLRENPFHSSEFIRLLKHQITQFKRTYLPKLTPGNLLFIFFAS